MKKLKLLGISIIIIGFWVLFYKIDGVYGWGGYVDKSIENIIISSILFSLGYFLIKKSN